MHMNIGARYNHIVDASATSQVGCHPLPPTLEPSEDAGWWPGLIARHAHTDAHTHTWARVHERQLPLVVTGFAIGLSFHSRLL